MAKATAGSMSAGFAKQAQDGSWQQGGKRKKTSWSRDDRAIELAFSPGKVVVGYEGSQITDRISEKGPYSLSLVFLGRCEVDEIVVSGAADPGWLESELVYEAARNKLLSGDWMDLTREMPASAWSTHGGKCAVSPGSITLDSAGALCRAWIPVSDRLVADGRDLSFRVEVKRLSDSGLFAIGFRVDGRDLAWLIRPDRDEPAPPEVPEEYALASIAPFEDGEYHVITVEFRGSEAVLYVDGALREVLGIEDIKAMEPGNLKPAGLGFSAAGGKFEVKSFSLRRNAR